MKNLVLIGIVFFFFHQLFSQDEGIVNMASNPQINFNKNLDLITIKSNTFDSTFIYTLDTLNLPIFDEFSTDKFQKYNVDFSDPGATSILVYHLHDSTNNPLLGGETYSLQPTFKRTVDLANSTFIDEYFSPI